MDGQTWVPPDVLMRDEFARNHARTIRNQYCAARAYATGPDEEHACTLRPAHWGDHSCDCGATWRNELHSQCLGNNGADTVRYLNLVQARHPGFL